MKFSRETTSGQFIPEIDGLRFIAVLYVVLFHLSQRLTKLTGRTEEYDPLVAFLSHGHFGVQFFFVISGAVIALPFAKGYLLGEKVPKLKDYFLRRLTRLEPPYILHLFILFVLLLVFIPDNNVSNQFPHLLASFGYLHNIIYGTPSTISNVAWSLEVEFQFYALAPFIATIFTIQSTKKRRILLLLLITLFSLVSFFFKDGPAGYSILCHGHFFLAGFALIDFYITDWNQMPAKSFSWDVLGVVSWFAVFGLFYLDEVGEGLFIVPLLAAYCGAFRGKLCNRFFRLPPVYVIGGMCYSIYLYHFAILLYSTPIFLAVVNSSSVISDFMISSPLWLLISIGSLIFIPIILLVTGLFFIFIEKPCMRKDWHLKFSGWFRSARAYTPTQ